MTPRTLPATNEDESDLWNLPPSRGAWLRTPPQTSCIANVVRGVTPKHTELI
jgi:hypothetical protein